MAMELNQGESMGASRGLVMVVEDDEGIQAALGQALIEEGYDVVCASHGRQALDLLRSGPLPSLILLDLMMPVMDGRAFLEVRARDPQLADIPVVIITADTRATHDASSLDAQAILAKPLSLQTLLESVATFCRRPAPHPASPDQP
jgi:CheY-like chemotaxis protein